MNYALPYSDWDEGDFSIPEFKARFTATCREMGATLSLNILSTVAMMVPLWHTGKMNISCCVK